MTSEELSAMSKEERKKVPFKDLPKGNKIRLFITLFFIAAIVMAIVAGVINSSSKVDASKVAIWGYTVAKKVVEKNLKAPSTAKFPITEYQVWTMPDSTVVYKGYVDCQNSIGEEERKNYYVRLKWKADYTNYDNWECLDFRFE